MRAKEIFNITLLFVSCFIMTEIIVSYFYTIGAMGRFFLRTVFLVQYSFLIYQMFNSQDDVKKIRKLENNLKKDEKSTEEDKSGKA